MCHTPEFRGLQCRTGGPYPAGSDLDCPDPRPPAKPGSGSGPARLDNPAAWSPTIWSPSTVRIHVYKPVTRADIGMCVWACVWSVVD